MAFKKKSEYGNKAGSSFQTRDAVYTKGGGGGGGDAERI